MTRDAGPLAQAAAHFIGVPFRLHGRNPAIGLDCVGLLAAALEATGRTVAAPQNYGLRNSDISAALTLAAQNDLSQARGAIRCDDVLLVQPGPAQFHLLIAEHRNSFIHAHAGFRRVVRMPGPLDWPVTRHWRLSAKG